jgi:DNA/RNA endonuclease YhcR with UshA esterase domain
MVLVNIGGAYPNQLLTVALKDKAKSLASIVDGKLISITGKVIDYKGRPEIIVTDDKQIVILQ